MKFNTRKVRLLIAVFLGLTVLSCSEKDGDNPGPVEEENGNFIAWVRIGSSPNTTTFAIQLSDLESGVLSYEGRGVETDGKISYAIIPYKGHYYYHGNDRFGKYHLENNTLVVDQEVPFNHFSITAYAWTGENTLVLFGTNGDGNQALYATVDISTMRISTGTLAIPTLAEGHSYRLSLAKYRNDGNLFLVYGQYDGVNRVTEKKVSLAVLDPQTLTVKSTAVSEKTAVASTSGRSGLTELYQPFSFIDENNDIYFGTTSTADGFNSVIYRIKSGTTTFDNSYNAYEHATNIVNGLWYLGNGKAIMRTYNKEYGAYEVEFLYEYYEYDLATGSTKKLAIPRGKGHYSQNLAIHGSKAYIITNQDGVGDGNIWIYDIPTGGVSAGMTIPAGYSYLLRLDNMN